MADLNQNSERRTAACKPLRAIMEARGTPAGMDQGELSEIILSVLASPDPGVCTAGFRATEYLIAEDPMTWSLRYLSALFRRPEQARPALRRLTDADWLSADLRRSLCAAVARCAAASALSKDNPAALLKMADDTIRLYMNRLSDGRRFSPLASLGDFRARRLLRAEKAY